MSKADGDALAAELIDAVVRPEFVFEHDWTKGDVVLRDNYWMMHWAAGHPVGVFRVAHRTTLRGT